MENDKEKVVGSGGTPKRGDSAENGLGQPAGSADRPLPTAYCLLPTSYSLAPAIREVLNALRRRIRWYVWLEGLGWAVAWLAAAFWATLGLDRFLEPPPAARAVLLGLVGVVTLWILFRKILRRAFVPLGDPSMALLLERYFPQFGDSLLTTVELSANGATAEGLNPELVARTCRAAVGPLGEVRLPMVFNPRPLRTALVAAAVLSASVVLFGLLQSEAMGIWAERSLLLSDEPWPRTTRLVVEGFESGSIKVLRGTDYTVVALADRNMPNVPERVDVEFVEGGARKSKSMRHQRDANPQEGGYERFSYAFTSIMNPITFDVVGGDDAKRGLRIEVVDSPAIVTMEVQCEYPPYTGRPAKSFPVTGVMQFPWGSRLTVRATSNKDLTLVTVEPERGTRDGGRGARDEGRGARGESPSNPPSVVSLRPAPGNPRSFEHVVGMLTKETTLLFTLHDTDAMRSREPVQLTLSAVEDERPRLSARLQGIGAAGAVVAPRPMLPIVGQVTDDYGIARIWFEYAVDQEAAGTREIVTLPGNATEFALESSKTVFDAANLGLKPGQKLGICLKAADRFNMMGSGPNVGSSDRWVLEVVTPQQLQIMLKARQLLLRQQFEETVKKVEYTRNLLAAIDFSPPPKPEAAKKPETGKEQSPKKPLSGAARGLAESKPDVTTEVQSAAERLGQRTLDVRSAAENCITDAHEILGLAEAVSDIRQELINNRIDDEKGNEDKRRLQDEIAVPLRHIAGEMFPELDRVLDRLQETVADAAAGEKNRGEAVRKTDAILQEMRKVLGKMTRLEDLNEVIETLRSIIRDEEKVRALTKKRQRDSLTELKEKSP